MKNPFVLKRAYLDNCCIGKLYHDGSLIGYTVEKPWRNNEPNVSCIPPGVYTLKRYNSNKYKNVLSLENPALGVTVDEPSQRTKCLIHAANFPHELKGCIGPGLRLHPEVWGVADSRKALLVIFELFERGVDQLLIEI